MHDEVSETENIRKNLSIERQIVEGCEMLLDVNQIFIRQGSWLSVYSFVCLFGFISCDVHQVNQTSGIENASFDLSVMFTWRCFFQAFFFCAI